jgi:hypothetical protein
MTGLIDSQVWTLIELVLPVVVAAAAVVLALFPRLLPERSLKCHFPLLDLISIDREISTRVLAQAVLVLLAVGAISVPAFRDYSRFFPARMQMTVFFDDEGLGKALAQFTPLELDTLKVKANWIADKTAHFEMLNREIRRLLGVALRFDTRRGAMHSSGEVLFEVKRVGGWQRYRIVQAKGSLVHSFETPQTHMLSLASEFQLLESEGSFLRASLADIYLRYTKILQPEFKQIIRLRADRELYHHSVVAVTKVRFFPIVDIGDTVYFVRKGDPAELVPIGYAVYDAP